MNKRLNVAVVFLFTILGVSTASAGVRVGNHSTPYAGLALQQSIDDFGTGFKVYGGYEFMDFDMGKHKVYVSGEGAYLDFGKHNGISATGFSALANARMHLQKKFDVFAHAGLADTKVKYDICGPFGGCSGSKVGLVIGGGARYTIQDNIHLFAGVDNYSTDNGSQNELSFGGEMRF